LTVRCFAMRGGAGEAIFAAFAGWPNHKLSQVL